MDGFVSDCQRIYFDDRVEYRVETRVECRKLRNSFGDRRKIFNCSINNTEIIIREENLGERKRRYEYDIFHR